MDRDFNTQLKRFQQVQRRIPQRAATIAVNFSKERFRQKTWVDRKREPWTPRKRKGRGSTMTVTGRLKRSIRKIRVGKNYAIIGTNVSYAQIHNDGGVIKSKVNVKEHKRTQTRTGRSERTNLRTRKTTTVKRNFTSQSTVKAHTRQMNTKIPARTFLAPSALLARRIERQILADIKNLLK